ncbi:cysteine--tRNA ligase [soil metagenome]
MKLYNTLTKKVDEVKPLDGKTIRMYSCGPTVYDHSHIGNLSSFIFADTLRRAASTLYPVKHVMNFTDIDDKTIRRSMEQAVSKDSKENLEKLTIKYSALFLEDMKSIGNETSTIEFIYATKSIDKMQQLISVLHAGGFAYIAEDGVYFSISKYRESGKKYGQLLKITEASTSESRIQNDEYDKDSAHDFALWKVQKEGEPAWDFELDGRSLNGRPGWHIECSAMSQGALGLPFDIHTGGIDLIFPHHENEIAQSTAMSEVRTMATIFAHNGHLYIDGKKMSKSLNNFYTLEDIKQKGFEPLAYRLMVLQSHYRSEANFTWEVLGAAQNRLDELRAWADLRHQQRTEIMPVKLDELFSGTRQAMQEAIEDDLNTPMALAALNKLVSYMLSTPIPKVDKKYIDDTLSFIDSILGLNLSSRPDITAEQKQLIKSRENARKAKNWEESDRLRGELKSQGLDLKDTEDKTIWSRLGQK